MNIKVDIVLPVLNEEGSLLGSVAMLQDFLAGVSDWRWTITIVDNGSSDDTQRLARRLEHDNRDVTALRLEERGRGRALKEAWLRSDADVLCYMDIDLSTGLEALPTLVEAVIDEGFDIAIGSRLLKKSNVVGRSMIRGVTSRMYSFLFRLLFSTPFCDAQCGFKALTRESAQRVLPLTKDTGWFFDTELLLIAQKSGMRIKELPVEWKDDPDSRVSVIPTAWRDLLGLMRLKLGGVPQA